MVGDWPLPCAGWLVVSGGLVVVVVVNRVRGGNVIVTPEFCGFLLFVN